jgi:hypothetical protein
MQGGSGMLCKGVDKTRMYIVSGNLNGILYIVDNSLADNTRQACLINAPLLILGTERQVET